MTDVQLRSGGAAVPSDVLVTRDSSLVGDGSQFSPLGVADPAGGVPFKIEAIEIFARTTGSDADGDGSLAAPYRTFQRAIIDVPGIISPGRRYVVDVTGITETLPDDYQFPVLQSPLYQAAFVDTVQFPYFSVICGVTIRADVKLASALSAADATITDADGATVVAQVGSNLSAIQISAPRASWAGGALKGLQIVRSSGLGTQGSSCCVYDSDATHLFVTNDPDRLNGGAGALVLAPGQVIRIVEPSAVLQMAPAVLGIQCMNVSSVNFQGIRFRSTSPGNFALGIGNMPAPFFELCAIEGMFSVQIADELAIRATTLTQIVDCEATALVLDRCYVAGVVDLLYLVGTIVDFTATVFDGCATLTNGVFVGSIPNNNWGFADVLITGSQGDAILATGGQYDLVNVVIDDAAGSAIRAEQGMNYLLLTNVTGTGNGGLGVSATDGAQIQIRDTDTNVTGTGGDMQSGSQLVRTWADFYGTAPIGNEYDLVTPFVADSNGVLKPQGQESGSPCTGTRIFQRTP